MFSGSLSRRFLSLTVLFVLIAEVLIFVPSVARFRVDYLQNRLELAQLAALAKLAAPMDGIDPAFERELLETADVYNVVLQRDGVRELALRRPMDADVAATFRLEEEAWTTRMNDAMSVLVSRGDRVIRVIGRSDLGLRNPVEVTLDERPLREALIAYGLRILYISLALSLATGALLFAAVRGYIVAPIRRVVDSMTAYRDDPEDASRVIAPQSSVRELREAETALQDLQQRLTGALKQKDRLAALGGAVAKISHDLRNLLTTAQLLADRIEGSGDPAVRRTAPKLVNSLDRAIKLCERTLTYGKAEEPPPSLGAVTLAPLVGEVMENEAAAAGEMVSLRAEVPDDLVLNADADQLFRVLSNLVRNAAQAIESSGRPGSVTVRAACTEGRCEIEVSDTGPGLPPKARDNLFQPFRGGARQGGSGLGLVIASELVRGHGGTLTLGATGPEGTTFRISLPGGASIRQTRAG
jgi:signal transduction histidine kinase